MQQGHPTDNELEVLIDTMAEGLIVIGPDHRIQRWNRSMTRLTGYDADEALGRPCTMLRGEDSPCLEKCLGLVSGPLSEAARVDGEEAMIRRKDGALVPLLVHARAIPDGAGGSQGAVVTFTDMTRVRRLEEENRRLQASAARQERFHELVGRSEKMRELFRLVELAAASDESILITGETGTGKELVARAIHRHSARADGPLVTVNCAALSESLLESELFGHVKGAFTGAIRDYQGRFEQAHGGVLFLDEVGDLPPLVQVKLLRVIQERVIERVGEGRPRPVNVRLIAATHRDLRARVREGLFREDLFYRLNVFPIHVPPLRERREDIPLLLDHFRERFADRTGKRIDGFTPDALRILMDHCWPGNVRELENAVAHAFITCPGGHAGPFDLPVELRQVDLRRGICDADAAAPARFAPPRPRGRLPREVIEQALRDAAGNKAEAARRLGMDRSTLWRHMKAHGMA